MPDRRPLPFGFLDEHALHICIDMQRIFLEPGPWYAEAGLAILPKIEQIVHARNLQTIFTKFLTPTQRQKPLVIGRPTINFGIR